MGRETLQGLEWGEAREKGAAAVQGDVRGEQVETVIDTDSWRRHRTAIETWRCRSLLGKGICIVLNRTIVQWSAVPCRTGNKTSSVRGWAGGGGWWILLGAVLGPVFINSCRNNLAETINSTQSDPW